MRAPAGVLPVVLVEVVTRAGLRCQCSGACGRKHRDSGGRCASEHGTARPLFAAPSDPAVPEHTAWQVPVTELAAWCGPCLDAARRQAARKVAETRAAELAAATDALFTLGGAA